MAPHLTVLAIAFALSTVARLILRGKTPLIVACAVLLTTCGLLLLVGERPSMLGLALATLLSAVGAVAGVLAATVFLRLTSARL